MIWAGFTWELRFALRLFFCTISYLISIVKTSKILRKFEAPCSTPFSKSVPRSRTSLSRNPFPPFLFWYSFRNVFYAYILLSLLLSSMMRNHMSIYLCMNDFLLSKYCWRGKEGARTFFDCKNDGHTLFWRKTDGARTFFRGKMTGQGLFPCEKMTGQGLFSRGKTDALSSQITKLGVQTITLAWLHDHFDQFSKYMFFYKKHKYKFVTDKGKQSWHGRDNNSWHTGVSLIQ
jgi:hypothetical protein